MYFMNLPILYRVLAIAALVLGLVGFGYYKGYSHEKEKFDTYKAEVEAAAMTQEAKVKTLEKQATNINKDVSNAYNRDLAAVRAYYQRLLNHQGSGELSKVPSGSSGAYAGTEDQLPSQCSETTLQLIYLQQWVREQEQLFNQGE